MAGLEKPPEGGADNGATRLNTLAAYLASSARSSDEFKRYMQWGRR
ncbi:MAG: hypothetical protein HYT08_03945 [Candidatus Levybacteria bacterium]|nr:hypothetical protein [Candidatus Levybacteria bacterium]